MSADNGIYILETNSPLGGKEYRVKELQAIENLHYKNVNGKWIEDHSTETEIQNAREMFNNCKVYNNLMEVEQEAERLLLEIEQRYIGICEYGIGCISIPEVF